GLGSGYVDLRPRRTRNAPTRPPPATRKTSTSRTERSPPELEPAPGPGRGLPFASVATGPPGPDVEPPATSPEPAGTPLVRAGAEDRATVVSPGATLAAEDSPGAGEAPGVALAPGAGVPPGAADGAEVASGVGVGGGGVTPGASKLKASQIELPAWVASPL